MARRRLEVALDEADVQALRQVDKKSQDWRARERARTLLLLGQGKSLEEVAQSQDVTTRTVRNTWARWCREGLDSLLDKPRCGAPRKLDEAALERLTQWANDKPLTAVQLLQRHIEEQGAPVHVNTLVKALKRANFVWKRTRHSLKKSATTTPSTRPAKTSSS